jgi:hypothetical protein
VQKWEREVEAEMSWWSWKRFIQKKLKKRENRWFMVKSLIVIK